MREKRVNMKVILASASPRRKELMDMMGVSYEVVPSQFEEKRDESLERTKQVENLSYGKAKDVFQRTSGDRIVIGCDTLVYCNGKFYGKPKVEEVARKMLRELSGETHEVITGLTVLVEKDGKIEEYIDHNVTKIHIKDMTDEEINKWVETGKALDKAGAYAIQEEFCVFIDHIDGSYFSTIGLPVHQLYDVLKKYI